MWWEMELLFWLQAHLNDHLSEFNTALYKRAVKDVVLGPEIQFCY